MEQEVMSAIQSGQLFTWDALYTVGQSSLLTFLIVQFTKDLVDRFLKVIPTDVYAVAVAFAILMVTNAANDIADLSDWRTYVLAFFNSFLVAASSSYVFQKAANAPSLKKYIDGKKKKE